MIGEVPVPKAVPKNDSERLDKILCVLQAVLVEMKVTNHLLQAGLNVKDDLDNLRNSYAS